MKGSLAVTLLHCANTFVPYFTQLFALEKEKFKIAVMAFPLINQSSDRSVRFKYTAKHSHFPKEQGN